MSSPRDIHHSGFHETVGLSLSIAPCLVFGESIINFFFFLSIIYHESDSGHAIPFISRIGNGSIGITRQRLAK
jgi:hypothetical protein